MSGKLSERFQELKTTTGASNKIKTQNRQKNAASQQQQRTGKFNQSRGLPSTSNTDVKTNRRTANAGGSRTTPVKGGRGDLLYLAVYFLLNAFHLFIVFSPSFNLTHPLTCDMIMTFIFV
jgi:hypothetical protein